MESRLDAAQLERHRTVLTRYAMRAVSDADLAQDLVQDTFVAALSSGGFRGESSLRTWLTGILKHKIVDAIRRKVKAPVPLSVLDDEGTIDDFDGLFRSDGRWDAPPADWGDPEAALNQRQFFDVMEFCLEKLPPQTGRVFMMREVMELETDEICKELAITANNLWVILYRARMALRVCLEQHWFAGGARRPTPA